MALVLDTGPLYASLDRRDADHDACRRLLLAADEPLVIPAPVLVELDQLLSRRSATSVFPGVLRDIVAGLFAVLSLETEDYIRVEEICTQYADTPIGFVDAAVLAIVERLNEPKLATLDRRHFGMMRPRHVGALRLLPE